MGIWFSESFIFLNDITQNMAVIMNVAMETVIVRYPSGMCVFSYPPAVARLFKIVLRRYKYYP